MYSTFSFSLLFCVKDQCGINILFFTWLLWDFGFSITGKVLKHIFGWSELNVTDSVSTFTGEI